MGLTLPEVAAMSSPDRVIDAAPETLGSPPSNALLVRVKVFVFKREVLPQAPVVGDRATAFTRIMGSFIRA